MQKRVRSFNSELNFVSVNSGDLFRNNPVSQEIIDQIMNISSPYYIPLPMKTFTYFPYYFVYLATKRYFNSTTKRRSVGTLPRRLH